MKKCRFLLFVAVFILGTSVTREQAVTGIQWWSAMGERVNAVGAGCAECVFTFGWQSWTLIENFGAWRDIPLATRGNGFGVLDTELGFNSPVHVEYILG